MSGDLRHRTDPFESDQILIEKAAAGHIDAQAQLVECARAQVRLWCARLLRDRSQAEDTTQEVLVRMWQHVGDLQDPRAFPAWLYRITLNVCQRKLRSELDVHGSVFQDLDSVPNTGPSLEEMAVARCQLDRLLSELDAGDQLLLNMKYGRQLTGHEMGNTLGISDEAARTRLHGALKRLRNLFRKVNEP